MDGENVGDEEDGEMLGDDDGNAVRSINHIVVGASQALTHSKGLRIGSVSTSFAVAASSAAASVASAAAVAAAAASSAAGPAASPAVVFVVLLQLLLLLMQSPKQSITCSIIDQLCYKKKKHDFTCRRYSVANSLILPCTWQTQVPT